MNAPVHHAQMSRAAPKAILIRWWQGGKVAPLDCTTFSCAVLETTLPFVPVIAPHDLAQGWFRIVPPAPNLAAELIVGQRYPLHVVLRNALGEAIEDMTFALEVV